MDFTTKEQLYDALLPVFSAKQRLLGHEKYYNINNKEIWSYLVKTKWIHARNLSLSEVVNDLILLEPKEIINYKGELNEQKKENN